MRGLICCPHMPFRSFAQIFEILPNALVNEHCRQLLRQIVNHHSAIVKDIFELSKGYPRRLVVYYVSVYEQRRRQILAPGYSTCSQIILLGKPPEQTQQEKVVFIINCHKDTDTQDAEVVDGDQKSLPEGEKE